MTCHTTFPCWHLHFATSKYQMDLIQSTVELDWTHSLTDVSNRWYGKTFLRQKLMFIYFANYALIIWLAAFFYYYPSALLPFKDQYFRASFSKLFFMTHCHFSSRSNVTNSTSDFALFCPFNRWKFHTKRWHTFLCTLWDFTAVWRVTRVKSISE